MRSARVASWPGTPPGACRYRSGKNNFVPGSATLNPSQSCRAAFFFDLRHGAGSPGLTQSLRTHLDTLLSEQAEVFFYHMVQNSLKIQVPPGMLRRLWLRFYPTPDLKTSQSAHYRAGPHSGTSEQPARNQYR